MRLANVVVVVVLVTGACTGGGGAPDAWTAATPPDGGAPVANPCAQVACVWGACVVTDGGLSCRCQDGYAGALCDGCAPGFHPRDLRCVPDTPCDPSPCVEGACSTADGGASCACRTGWAGPLCDVCDQGYRPSGSTCVANTPCDPNPCVESHRTLCAVDARGAATCLCLDGYLLQGGQCVLPSTCDAVTTCSGHGECVEASPPCACHAGYAGPACVVCAPGYHDVAGGCVPDTPCDPNPCLEANRARCQEVAGVAQCSCDDGHRSWRGRCVSRCDTPFSYVPARGETVTSLYVRTDHDAWSLDHPMTREEDGTWTALVRLPAGDHAYKLFVPGATQASDRWFEDPASPYHAWVGGVRNSRVRVRDCAVPLLELVDVPVVTGTGVSFQVRYVDGSAAAGLDAASARVTRNDEPVPGTIDVATGLFTVADTGLAKTRHTYRFHAQDRQGRVAAMLYVPVWVEDRPFSWRDATLYFALTDRFVDGDPTNNAPTPGVDPRANWHGGDLAGLLQTLEDGYFDRLSVNALWVSSVSQNTSRAGEGQNGDAHTYSGYHSYWPISTGWRPDNPLPGVVPVDPHFGDLALFKQVVRAAHARGIRVVMDLVANHVHEDSPLWAAHREGEASWFHAFFQCGFDEAPISCWFTPYLPDLDFTRLPALDAVVEHAVWLAQEGELDGFRLDAVKHMVHDLPRALRARLAESIQGTPERFFLVGETFTDESARGAATIREYVNAAELDGQFDFPLMWRVASTFLREDATFATLETKLQQWAGYYGPEAVMSTFLGNHDLARALSLAAGDVDGTLEQAWDRPPVSPASEVPYRRLRLAWTFLLTTPGVPLIYYGDEFGMPGAVDPDNRRPMRFNLSPGGQEQATLDHVTALSAARAAHPATRQGHRVMLHLGPDGLTWAYGMVDGQDRVVVAFNRRESAERVVVGLGALGFLDGDVLRDVVGGGQVTVAGGQVEVELPSRASAVLVAAP